ncbi:MAG: GIY-YIG nuclease family protein [Pseudohongiellaceae bacterium]|nr:GIY-YIG nuclease family protein [Pseudohongiellaceae bacterium]
MQDTIYIAEPVFSETMQKFDSESAFPPIKKIGITTGLPQRREKELLGTVSPVKVSIVKAWTGIEARKIETMLHSILDNTRLDGEYFWDGNETLVDSVTEFMNTYHSDAKEIGIQDDADVKAATDAVGRKHSQRILTEVVPELDKLSIDHKMTKSMRGVRFRLGDYTLHLGGKTGGRYTLTIFSKIKSTEDALQDFPHSQELSAHGSEDSPRCARIPMSNIDEIMDSLRTYVSAHGT